MGYVAGHRCSTRSEVVNCPFSRMTSHIADHLADPRSMDSCGVGKLRTGAIACTHLQVGTGMHFDQSCESLALWQNLLFDGSIQFQARVVCSSLGAIEHDNISRMRCTLHALWFDRIVRLHDMIYMAMSWISQYFDVLLFLPAMAGPLSLTATQCALLHACSIPWILSLACFGEL